jgi:hypothetical protein
MMEGQLDVDEGGAYLGWRWGVAQFWVVRLWKRKWVREGGGKSGDADLHSDAVAGSDHAAV